MADEVEDWKSDFEERAKAEDKKAEVQAKKLIIDENRYNVELARIAKTADEASRANSTNFGLMSPEAIAKVQTDNIEYIMAARGKLNFITAIFSKVVPFFRKNLILIGAKSGHGKSTTVANIARETLRQIDPTTGKPPRVLVITNEEKTEDVYNRVTCLLKGWHYVNHDEFTDEQVKAFNDFIPVLSKYMNVVDDNYNNVPGMTTSLEGVCQIFDNMLRDGTYYHAVIFDYYQNVTYSKDFPSMTEFEVQAALSHKLDQYKNSYPAPIVVMAQCDPPDEANTPFMFRIKGRKLIFAKATLAMEMVAEPEMLRTQWEVWKSRFTNSIGKKFYTAYDKGKITVYDDEFAKKVMAMKENDMHDATLLGNLGKKPVDDKGKKE
jgi:hypothetical protein